MTFNKNLVTAAVGASLALGAGVASAYNDAHYDSILIPYVVKDTNRTTVVTLMSTHNEHTAGAELHLQYWTKPTTAANTAACEPSSSFMSMTANDVVTFDTAGILGFPLFGDTTNAAPLGTSIAYAGPRHGYLLVDHTDDHLEAGFWVELDLANGGAHGGIGYPNFNDGNDYDLLYPLNTVLNSSFDNVSASNIDAEFSAPVNFWPASIASTAFTVTPLGTDMLNSDNTSVILQVLNDNYLQGAFDRNENGIDGTVPQTVRCIGRLTASQLMPGVVANAAWATSGGWGYLANLGDNSTNAVDRDAIVYQVDSSNAAGAGKFMSNATPIVSTPADINFDN